MKDSYVKIILISFVLTMCFSSCINDDEDEQIALQTIEDHEYVDLGLSVKWATCNVGALNPEENGSYFSWGETEEKALYQLETYKYWINLAACKFIGMDISGTEYDVARAQWGGTWRMPTEMEFRELIDKCVWTNVIVNGKEAFEVVGPNGNSILMNLSGYIIDDSIRHEGTIGHFWLSTAEDNLVESLTHSDSKARLGYIGKKPTILRHQYKYIGCSVRPVSY